MALMCGRPCSPPPATPGATALRANPAIPATVAAPALRATPALLAVLVLGLSASAQAQERAGSFYLTAGVAAAHQSGAADGVSQVYIAAPGGTTAGWSLAAGVFVGSRVSVEAECAGTGMLRAREPSRYFMTYIEERRERYFGANVRLHLLPGRLVDIEPVAGIALVRRDRWSQTETYRAYMPPEQALTVGPRVRYDTLTGASASAGADLRIGGRHVAFVPSFRVRVATRGEKIESYYPAGYPAWSLAAGAGLRVDF